MQGSLALRHGILYVAHHAVCAHVAAWDLDGHRLGAGFAIAPRAAGHAAAAGIAVDDDRRVWVADTPAGSVRCFTLFGREIGCVQPLCGERVSGARSGPTAVAVRSDALDLRLVVGLGGLRRQGVQVFDGEGQFLGALRSQGELERPFRRVVSVALGGRFAYVCEAGAARIQVFRDGEFHFLFRLPRARGASDAEVLPRAVAPLPDGRLVVACAAVDAGEHAGSALLLLDGAGKLVRVLAEHGTDEGSVFEPGDVVVDPGACDKSTRLAAIDRDGERVQVFTLEGRCFGAFSHLAG